MFTYRCWSWRWCGNLCHSSLDIIFEGGDVTFSLYNDAEWRSQGDIPSSLGHHDFGQISLLLHLKAYTQTHDSGMLSQVLNNTAMLCST